MPPLDPRLTIPQYRIQVVLLLCLLLLAAFLRLWQLDQLPPGLYFDEAYNGVDALTVLEGQSLPLYFPANNGREPVFIYLVALFIHFLGSKAYALRLCAAMIGILTVPIFYFAAKIILQPQREQRPTHTDNQHIHWTALIAAAVIALSFWHLSLSRLAFRVILLPPLSALAIAYFWRAWTTQRLRDYGWAGFWLATTLYTYIAARLLPIVIILFVLQRALGALLLVKMNLRQWWKSWRQYRRGLLVMTATLLFALLPFFYAIYQDPSILFARSADVSIFSGKSGPVLEQIKTNLFATILSFYTKGELLNPRHNLPGRPVLDWPLALFFTIGWLRACWQLRNERNQLILLWFIVMLAPTFLSTDAPHTLRSTGALPPLVLLITIGLQTPLIWRTKFKYGNAISVVAITVVLSLSGTYTVRDYFYRWARLPILGAVFEQELQLATERVAAQLDKLSPDKALLLSRRIFLSPQMRFKVGSIPRQDLPEDERKPLLPGNIDFLIEENSDPNQLAFLLRAQAGKVTASWLNRRASADTLPLFTQLVNYPYQLLASPIHQTGWPRLLAGKVTTPPLLVNAKVVHYPLNINFANGMKLIGYDIIPIPADRLAQPVWLRTFWQRLPSAEPDYANNFRLFSHLIFNGQQRQQQYGELGNNYPLPLWAFNETMDDTRFFSVEEDAVGKAYFELGLYRSVEGKMERINMLDGNGNVAADQVTIGATWIGGQPPTLALASFRPLRVHFAQRIALVGWQWAAPSAAANQLQVTLAWRALDRMTTAYTSFVHLLDAQQNIVAQSDQPPAGIENPTSLWAPGEEAQTVYQLPIEPGTDLSQMVLRVGLYEPVSGLQLPITSVDEPELVPENATYLLLKLK